MPRTTEYTVEFKDAEVRDPSESEAGRLHRMLTVRCTARKRRLIRHWLALSGIACGVAMTMTGCMLPSEPEMIGYSGVGRGEDGHVIGYVVVCDGSIGSAQLLAGAYGDDTSIATWTSSHPVTGFTVLDAESPSSEWNLDPNSTLTLEHDELYDFAANGGEGRSTRLVTFYGAELAAVKPGLVLTSLDQHDVILSEAEFAQLCTKG